MHPLFQNADKLSHTVIRAAIEVHRVLGSGLIESIYERCLIRELTLRGVNVSNQKPVTIDYNGMTFEEPLRLDLVVENCLIVELKSVEQVLGVHKAQLLSYMKLLNIPIGLLINFHQVKLIDGISRMILSGANK